MSRKLDTIKEINDTKETWKLAVRITDVWTVQYHQKPPHIEMIFMDAKGDKIQVTTISSDLDYWKLKVKEDTTYIIQNVCVKPNDLEYKACVHNFRLMLTKGTGVKQQELPEIPENIYQFKDFDEILCGKVCVDQLVDVIGEFHKILYKQPNPPKNKVVISMKDLSGNMLSYTLWEQHASKLLSLYERKEPGPIIIILTQARIREAQGIYPISISNSMFGSKLLINDNVVAIQQFKNSLDSGQHSESYSQGLSQLSSYSQGLTQGLSEQEKFMHNAQVKTISEVNCLMQETLCVTVGTIVKFFTGSGWFYEGCFKCNRKAPVENEPFTCSCQIYNPQPVLRYKLEVDVLYKKQSSKFVLWDTDCVKLIGKHAVDLRQQMIAEGEEDPKAFPEPLDIILGKTLAFRFKAQPRFHSSSVIKVDDDAHFIESIEKLFGQDEEKSTPDKRKFVVVGDDVQHDTQSLSATADHDPDVMGSVTPAKRISSDMPHDDLPTQDSVSAQLSSTKVTKQIKIE